MANNNETTTKFKVDISELKKSMQDARKQVALANSEFKAASSGMENWSKSSDGISAKLKQLNSNLTSQKRVLAEYEKALEEVKEEYGENSTEAMEYQTRLNNQRAVVNNLERQIDDYGEALDTATQAEEIANRTGRDAADIFDELADSAEDAGNSAEASSDGYTVMKGVLANLVTDGIRKAVDALKEFATEAINTGMEFEAAMSEVAAISGATGEDLKLLEETAKEYGSTTVFSASEAAQALKYMALAGWDAKTATSALGGVLDLASSSGMDLAQASDMVTDYLSAFGMEADQSTYFADMLAFSQSNANTSAEQLGEAYKNCAANLNAAGQDVETTTALLSMMANQGFKGSEAGTALTAVMRDMSAKMFELEDATQAATLKQNGFKSVTGSLNDMLGQNVIKVGKTLVAVSDAKGNYRDLTDILKDVEKATNGLGEAERATALSSTFTADSTKGMNLILNAGVGEAEKFEEALRDAGGTAAKMGETMNDNAAGDVKALESALEGVKISVYKDLQPTIREFIKYLTKDGINLLKDTSDSLVALAKKSIPYVKQGIEILAKVVKFAADNFDTLLAVILTSIAAFKTLKAVMAIGNTITAFTTATQAATTAVTFATKAQELWNAAMAANVIGAVLSAVVALGFGIASLINAQEDAVESTDLLTESQREALTAAQEAAEAYHETKDAANELAAAESSNSDYTRTLWNELETLADKNGKVKEGYEDRAQYIINQLNDALGTEYKMNGNIIDQYGDMKKNIEDVIEAKKAQMLLAAYEDTYAEAVKNVSSTEQARATASQELAAQQKVLTQAQNDYTDAYVEYHKKYDGLSQAEMIQQKNAMFQDGQRLEQLEDNLEREKSTLEEKQTAYNDLDQTLSDYYSNINNYETASTLIIGGKTEEAIGYLGNLGDGFKTASGTAKESAEKQKDTLEQQVIDTQVNLKLMEDEYKTRSANMTKEEKTQAEARIKNAKKQADDAIVEFNKVGGNITKGIADGAESEEWTLTKSMTKIIDSAVAAAKKAGVIKSPSRRFKKEVGRYLGLGVAAGVDDSTKDVVKSVKSQVNSIKNAYGSAVNKINPDITGVNSVGVTGGTVNNFYQTNNSPKALSRLEIYRQSKNLLGYAGGVR